MNSELYERPYNLVHDQIGQMSGRADDALHTAQDAIRDLLNIPSPIGNTTPPRFDIPNPQPTAPSGPKNDPKRPDYHPLTGIGIPNLEDGQALIAGSLESADGVPVFTPPFTTLNIPNAPAPIDTSGLPESPLLAPIVLPDAPSLPSVDLGDLLAIRIPTFAGLNLPTFTDVAPVFTDLDPDKVLAWTEPVYVSTGLTDLKATIHRMFQGGTGLTPEIEQALFDRTRARVDIDGERKVQEASATWAGKGFEMPPGMLVEAVDAEREQNRLNAMATAREILVQAAQWEIENLRQAVTQGIALEGSLIAQFNNVAARGFEAAKYRVEADIAVYNAKVGLFRARMDAYQIGATVFEARIRGELAHLEAFKGEIEAQQAIGQVNEQTVRVYQARLAGLASLVDLYKARVGSAQVLADVGRTQIEGYRARVQAYGERIGADKTRFEAFTAQIAGETAKVGLIEASARAFAATVQGYEAKANIKVGNVKARVESMQAATARFIAQVEAEKARVGGDTEIVRSQAAEFTADVQKYVADLGDATEQKKLDITVTESRLRNNLAYYEIQVREYDQALTRLLEEMKVRVEALKTVASATAQISAGAFAAMHVSASMTGAANVSDQYSRQDQYRFDGSA
jgi:hypothetical protein